MAKKNPAKTPQEAVEAPQEAVEPAVETVAPIKPKKPSTRPTHWIVTPQKTRKDGTEKTSELVWYDDKTILAKIPVTADNFQDLMPVLGARLGHEDSNIQPDEWFIKVPPVPANAEPVLSFTRNGKILMALPMNPEFLTKFRHALDAYVEKPPTKSEVFNTWWKAHKRARIWLMIFLIPILVGILAGFGRLFAIGA